MSSEWPVVSVEQACELIVDCVNKTAPVVPYPTPYRMVRTTNIRDGRISLESCRFVEEVIYEKWTRRAKLKYGDVLLTREAPIGEVGFVVSPEGLFLGQRVMQYRADVQKLHPRFLHYVFQSPSLQHQFGSHEGSGSVVSHIRVGECFKFKIPLPELGVQQRVAGLLGSLDDRITLLHETNATLEAIAQALFKSWFVDFDPVRAKAEGRQPEGMDAATAALFPDSFEESELGLVPKGWTVARLGDVTERITKGTTPTTLKRPFVDSGINFVKVESLTNDGQLLPDKFAYIDDGTHQLLARSQLKAGDVLITIAGTIGRVAVMTADFIPANTNQAVAIVRPDSNKLPTAFVNQFLCLANSKSRMGERVVQAVQANLSLGSLSDMTLVMPPPELVKKLHDLIFDSVGSKRDSNQQRIRTLTQLRDTLLPRLISGQLRLPEAEILIEEAR